MCYQSVFDAWCCGVSFGAWCKATDLILVEMFLRKRLAVWPIACSMRVCCVDFACRFGDW